MAAGLPVPDVTYTSDGAAPALAAAAAAGTPTTITSTTVITYAGPDEAGYATWPALVLEDSLPPGATGTVDAGDYTDQYREAVEDASPGYWDTTAFGTEPRTRIVEETITVTPGAATPLASEATRSRTEDVLMGFTATGPRISHEIRDEYVLRDLPFGYDDFTVWSYRVGYSLDWAAGLRLPARVDLTGPDRMTLGQDHLLTSTLTPLDWSAADYTAAGVAPENGNEFVLRLQAFAGASIVILGAERCGGCAINVDSDHSRSFATPLGSGSTFPIPAATMPVWDLNLSLFSLGIDVGFEPRLGSSAITGQWAAAAGSDCSGSGTVTYTAPGAAAAVGPVRACNLGPTDLAEVRLSDFRYWFNEFVLRLTGSLRVNLFGYTARTDPVELTRVDLSRITGGTWLGDHAQCDSSFRCARLGPDDVLSVSAPAVDTAGPVTSLSTSGTAGTAGWFRSDVVVSASATDNPPTCGVGVGAIESRVGGVGPWGAYTGPLTITAEGRTLVEARATDLAGNLGGGVGTSVKIDRTTPVLTGAATRPPDAAGWYRTPVVVHFAATDALSGVLSVTPDVTVGTDGRGQSVVGKATDRAGNTTYLRVSGLNVDRTPPSVSILRPSGSYATTTPLSVRWQATDVTSGVRWQSGRLDGAAVSNGQTVDLRLFTPGEHRLTVTVQDHAGNRATVSRTFTVTVDAAGVAAAVRRLCETGAITGTGTCSSLQRVADAAARAEARGDDARVERLLGVLSDRVEARRGASVSAAAADLLAADVADVVAHLDGSGSGS